MTMKARLEALLGKLDSEPEPGAEPGRSVFLGRCQVADELRALLRDSERLEQLEELDITGSDVRGDKLDPRALTAADEDRIVAKTLRVWAGIAQGFNAGRYDAATLEDALYLMADDMEGGE